MLNNIKFSFAGTLSAVIRTVIDVNKPVPSLGAGTIPEWIKAIRFKGDIEREAFLLLTSSIIWACRLQLKRRIEDINKNEDGTFIYLNREINFLGGDVNAGIETNDYILDLQYFDNPQSFPLLADFKPFYTFWLLETFPLSKSHANDLAADFPDYFAYAFQMELAHSTRYPEIIKAYNNPFNEKVALTLARRQYRMKLKELYHIPALGEPNIALSDVYIEPDFLVYDAIFPEEKRKQLQEENKSHTQHFLFPEFKGNIHDYLTYHFLLAKQSKAIGAEVEHSRMLILMGQPGHGKSSFCYCSIYNLLKSQIFMGILFWFDYKKQIETS